ncbi:hypothetical protein BO78DRAFT_394777 [Aspergillus sclerotiicarbonarius CBS 121057]|uniref:Uncharacterized protein n=1 Tax=Aspergillus sclerotiicarbonarius (strain CBS 121057 / IBT 28362) TaxID=1448318 RepID=A0A319FLL3_ASPSB|nr:hypothetical protein BO78DRAFT_394777 [Aspergillus sclerotiicarbonarius CBS 121057]
MQGSVPTCAGLEGWFPNPTPIRQPCDHAGRVDVQADHCTDSSRQMMFSHQVATGLGTGVDPWRPEVFSNSSRPVVGPGAEKTLSGTRGVPYSYCLHQGC